MPDPDIGSIIDRALGRSTGGSEPPEIPTIGSLVGAQLIDSNTGAVFKVVATGIPRNPYRLVGEGGRSIGMAALPSRPWITTTGQLVQFDATGNTAFQRTLTAAERAALLGGAGGEGGGGGAAAAASAAASLAESKRQFDIDFAENQRQFNAAQAAGDRTEAARLKANREAMLRGELNDLRQARISERMSARQQGTELAGVDPLRTLGALRARAVQGPTILDQFKTELGQAASFQEPMIGPNASIADLESAIAKLAQPILPQGGAASAFRPPGLEHGGTVSKEEVQPFSMGRPHPKTAIEFAKKAGMTTVMTGERSGGPELVIGKEFTVIPLSDEEEDELMHGSFSPPKAQGGVTVGNTFGLEGVQDLFRSLRERSGLRSETTGLPWLAGQTARTGDVMSRTQASALGAFQRPTGTLLKGGASDKVFVVDETGRARWIENPDVFNQSGQNW